MKTAGTSIEMALSKICGPDDIITPISKNDEEKRTSLKIRGAQNYFVPFIYYSKIDWLRFFLQRHRKQYYNHMSSEEILKNIDSKIWETYFKFCFERNPFDKTISLYYFRDGNKNFKSIADFIRAGGLNEIKGIDLYSINKIVAMDEVYHFENIPKALTHIQSKLNLTDPIKMPNFRAKSSSRKDKRHYKEVMTEEEINMVKQIYQRELNIFNYA